MQRFGASELIRHNLIKDCQKEQSPTVGIKYEDASRNVSIGQRRGNFPGILETRIFGSFGFMDRPWAGSSRPQRVVDYSGQAITKRP